MHIVSRNGQTFLLEMNLFWYGNLQIFEQENLLELYLKFFIWRTRCLKGILSLEAFINWFRIELMINQLAYGRDKKLRYLDIDLNRLEILPVL